MTSRSYRGQVKIAGTGFKSASGHVMDNELAKTALARVVAKAGYKQVKATQVSAYQDFDGVAVDVFNIKVERKNGTTGHMSGTVYYTNKKKVDGRVKKTWW